MKKSPRWYIFLLCLSLLCTPVYAETTHDEPVSGSATVVTLTEDEALREAYVKYFVRSDGTVEAVVYPEPVHYRQGDTWTEIDNSLTDAVLLGDAATGQVRRLDTLTAAQRQWLSQEAKTDRQVRYADYLENTANDFIVQLPRILESERPVMLRRAGHTLRFSPLGFADSVAYVTQPADESVEQTTGFNARDTEQRAAQEEQLTTITQHRAAVEYPSLSEQVDLRYYVSGQRLKEGLLFRVLPRQTEFSFDFSTDLRPVLHEDNTVSFLDAADNTVFTVEPPCMYDMGEGYNRNITVTVKPTVQGYRYTLTPDRVWLEAEERVYPVTLDSCIKTTQDSHYIQDAGVQQSNPNTNYYTLDRIYVGSGPNSTEGRMYFNLSQWPSANGLSADTITSAKLNMTYYPQASWQTGNNITIDVYRVHSSWNSNNITWNNQTNIGGTKIFSLNIGDHRQKTNGYDSYNVTDWVRQHYANSAMDYGIRLQPQIVPSSLNRVCYISSDYSVNSQCRPIVQITYDPSATPASGINSGELYYIRSCFSNKYLSFDSTKSYLHQHQFYSEFSYHQWRVTYVGSGNYTFYLPHKSAYLSIMNGVAQSGALFTTSVTPQHFKIIASGNSYIIRPSNSALVLDVRGPLMEDNTPIQLFSNENVSQQKWYFERVATAKDKIIHDKDVAVVQQNDHGWTTITLDYTYQEICNSVNNEEIYMYRSKSVTAKSSRANDDTPYTFNVSNVQHRDSNDNVIRTFDMVSSEYIIPAGLWGWSIKESGEFCSYSNTHANKGDIIISINGSIYPYAKRIVLELAY